MKFSDNIDKKIGARVIEMHRKNTYSVDLFLQHVDNTRD